MTNEEIIKAELQKVADEAVQLYERSGKKVSGNWPKGIKIETENNKGTLWSYAYLAGRGPTQNSGDGSLKDRILTWLKMRGITPIEKNMKLSSLAFVIARKIHREGTNKKYHREVFAEILTPQRIQSIIDKVSEFNVGVFVRDAEVIFQQITKKV